MHSFLYHLFCLIFPVTTPVLSFCAKPNVIEIPYSLLVPLLSSSSKSHQWVSLLSAPDRIRPADLLEVLLDVWRGLGWNLLYWCHVLDITPLLLDLCCPTAPAQSEISWAGSTMNRKRGWMIYVDRHLIAQSKVGANNVVFRAVFLDEIIRFHHLLFFFSELSLCRLCLLLFVSWSVNDVEKVQSLRLFPLQSTLMWICVDLWEHAGHKLE